MLAIGARLIFLQVFHYGDFAKQAQRQQQRSIDVAPIRGVIYDRNGHELAMSVSVDSIFAVPSEIPDQQSTAEVLAKVLNTDADDILARVRGSRAFAWVARKVDNDTSARVRALNLRGIYFQKESKRFYPKNDLGAPVLGYVGLDDEGLSGVEREFNQQLRGKPGRMLITMDAKRRWFGSVERQPQPGDNLVLTIDEKIQYIAERELAAALAQTHAASGAVIVQNPHTGEILALASRPSFNPNAFRGVTPEQLKNRAVSDVYEPGSTFKVITIAAALEERITNPDEVIDCQNGEIYIAGVRIRDHKKFGDLSVSQVLEHSSDVGAIKLGLRLGEERFDKYIRGFGFGAQTGVELPGETRGITKPVSRWSKVSIGAISMGQEIGVSPVQLISMISTIANDGLYTPPRILAASSQHDPAGSQPLQTVAYKVPEQRRVVSALTAVEMRRMMEGVVLRGTGRRAMLEGYTAGGKTGTAQKIDPRTGTYSHTQLIASFAGFAPVNNPAITVAVILDSPVGLHEGGQVAAPVFARVAQQTLAYLNVPHDVEVRSPQRMLLRAATQVKDDDIAESSPDRFGGTLAPAGEDASAAAAADAPAPATVASLRPASMTRQQPIESADAAPLAAPTLPEPPVTGGTVVVDVEGGAVVPTFVGKPLRQVIELAQEAGIELDVSGSGVARAQAPAPGTRIPAGAHVAVRFAR
ncbi:MAG: transpeptidase family protein [Candidatus Koribacter versatilis]|uniref:Transpeptidase family protein n=1 Tax=Candidatus Korobacter versatilis TaxID=658062 RepID=A0A932EPK5_9BACT|nr:transpeptidase family protein [Candidatus Koribacter versatilis]